MIDLPADETVTQQIIRGMIDKLSVVAGLVAVEEVVPPIRPIPWTPLPGPQTQGYESPADILFFGGAGGGGKSFLLLGLALTQHRKSIIFRREYGQLRELEEESRKLIGTRGRYNGQRTTWHLDDGRLFEFGAAQYPHDVQRYQGRPHDFIGVDEAPNFLEEQVRFLLAWMRTTTLGQRSRMVCTGNPPMDAEGEWIIQFFGPWLDPQHSYPAIPGELRWYATVDGKDVERQDGTPFEHKGEILTPMSRTFIPSRVEDNPYLMASGYKTVLQNLPEPLRSKMLHGDFSAGMEDNPWQVIPTAWVDAAMARWTEQKPDLPLSALGVDIARGGIDKTTIAKRYGFWFPPLKKYPGVQTPDGPAVAVVVLVEHEGEAAINMDIIGVGGSGYDHVKSVKPNCTVPMNGAEKSTARDRSGQLHFRNKRAEWHWKLREALDPATGDDLALPPDRELRADLIAPRWKLSAQGIQIEEKDEIKARLGRSPDSGEAVIYANAIDSRRRWLPIGE
jgi:Terminase large subunit, T4likevirus-type, N-terminal